MHLHMYKSFCIAANATNTTIAFCFITTFLLKLLQFGQVSQGETLQIVGSGVLTPVTHTQRQSTEGNSLQQ